MARAQRYRRMAKRHPRLAKQQPEPVEGRVGQGRRERGVLCTQATEDAAPRSAIGRLSRPGYRSHELRDVFRFLALVQQRGHLPEAARAAFHDRVLDQRLAPRRGRDVIAHADVQVGAGAPDRLDRRQRVADGARVREQFAALLLFAVQVHAADRHARLVLAVERQHQRRYDQAEREQRSRSPASPGAGRSSIPCAAPRAHRVARRASPGRTYPRPSTSQKTHERRKHEREKISGGAAGRSMQSPPTFRRAQGAALTWMPVGQPQGRGRTAMNILRRLPLSRLLLLCALALASACPRPRSPSPWAPGRRRRPSRSRRRSTTRSAARAGNRFEGVSANVTLTDHLLEGASLASGGGGGGSAAAGN